MYFISYPIFIGKILQHGEEADDALVNMLQLRKMNRKKGVLEAKRVQLLNRTRAIDILEVILSFYLSWYILSS